MVKGNNIKACTLSSPSFYFLIPLYLTILRFKIKWREAFIYLRNYTFIGLICLNDDFHIKAFSMHNWNKRTGYLWWLQRLLKTLVFMQNQAKNRVSYHSLALLWPAELRPIPSVWKFWCIFLVGRREEGMTVSKVSFVVSYPVWFFFFNSSSIIYKELNPTWTRQRLMSVNMYVHYIHFMSSFWLAVFFGHVWCFCWFLREDLKEAFIR